MALYKYGTGVLLKVLQTCRVRFSPIEALNDPFEALSDTRVIDHPDWFARHEERLINRLDFDAVLESVQSGKPRKLTRQEIRDRVRECGPLVRERMKDAAFDSLSEARKCFRLLCLTRVPPDDETALLLWGHYSDGHRGMVLEFDETHDWFTWHKFKNGEPHHAGDVIYDPKRPGWNHFPDGRFLPTDDFIFRKSPAWSYEREYRLVRFEGKEGVEVVGGIDALVSFPPECLRSVTFGRNMPEDVRQEVRRIRETRLTHLRLFHATIDRDEYRVNSTPDAELAG